MFRTQLQLNQQELGITYQDSLFFLGSCFSENISQLLAQRKFSLVSNPFGIAYNPMSIFKHLDIIIGEKQYSEKDIFCYNEIWNSFDFHSSISALNKETLLSNIDKQTQSSYSFLKKTKVLFMSLGTAWVHEYLDKDQEVKIAANCHKMPSKNFNKRLLSIDEIVMQGNLSIKNLKQLQPELNIVFTISPVRHLKDGFVENNQSKASLHLAVHKIVEQNKNVFYFPAYELLLDDLRDYRFYKDDLLHPNKLAMQYILQNFERTYFTQKTLDQVAEIDSVRKMLQHKVFSKNTDSFIKFKAKCLEKIEALEAKGFDFTKEKSKI